MDFDRKYPYEAVLEWLPASVAPLGADYQGKMREILRGQCIDVYENPGKRSGAYSAPVYGARPYMLLNYNDTLDAVFTLAHEMGHSMHTVLSHAHQPFVYAGYTIFVAEVPSTLNEALFLEYMLARTSDKTERIVLLQHSIDGIVSTFFTQVMFADYELQAHRLAEQGRPVTAEVLGDIYFGLLKAYHGDSLEYDDASRRTWARIPHFYSNARTRSMPSRHATCVSSAQLMKQITHGPEAGTRCGRRSLPDPPEVWRQRPPDGAAAAGRRRSFEAGNRARHDRPARRARHRAGKSDRVRTATPSFVARPFQGRESVSGDLREIDATPASTSAVPIH